MRSYLYYPGNRCELRGGGSAMNENVFLDYQGLSRYDQKIKNEIQKLNSSDNSVSFNGYTNDFFMFVMGTHPILSIGYTDSDRYYWEELIKRYAYRTRFARSISLNGNAQNITVYDGG